MTDNLVRDMPFDKRAEEAVLGSLLLERDAVIALAHKLRPGDFFFEKYGWVYAAMLDLFSRGEPSDTVTLASELERRGQLDGVGGYSHILSLVNRTPTAVHAEYYAKVVIEAAQKRALISVGGNIAALGYEREEESTVLLAKANQMLLKVSQRAGTTGYYTAETLANEFMDHWETLQSNPGKITGIPTGYYDLDELTGGLQKSDLIILAARTGFGKTALAVNIARNILRAGRTVGIFELEMSREQLVQRFVAIDTGINSQKLKNGYLSDDEGARVQDAIGRLSLTHLLVDDNVPMKLQDIRGRAHRMKAEHGLDLVIVDYLQLVATTERKDGNRTLAVGEISMGLKLLARELNVPLIACAQLNRAPEGRQDHRPLLSDLRESGSIENDADIVMFIHRDEMYRQTAENRGLAQLLVRKHRNGPLGEIPLLFDANTTAFRNMEIYRDAA